VWETELDAFKHANSLEDTARQMRRAEVRRLREDGLTFTQIGERLKISRQRAQQLFAESEPKEVVA
jgi:DNA-directed RNA polymerase sigma subunit (sigma70/sigma32)